MKTLLILPILLFTFACKGRVPKYEAGDCVVHTQFNQVGYVNFHYSTPFGFEGNYNVSKDAFVKAIMSEDLLRPCRENEKSK